MVGIVLASHGPLAEGMLEASKLFFGEQEQLAALGLYEDDSSEDFGNKITSAINEVNTGDGVYVLVDLLFGSPCNNLIPHLDNENVNVVTGLNLPLLVQLLDSREAGEIDIDELIEVGKSGICDLRATLAERLNG